MLNMSPKAIYWKQQRAAAKEAREKAWAEAKAKAKRTGEPLVTPQIVRDKAEQRTKERTRASSKQPKRNKEEAPDKSGSARSSSDILETQAEAVRIAMHQLKS